jgi:GDP/UDP-N,N'-diacetylbacillosamine 2-epimerase (hydrolysing)
MKTLNKKKISICLLTSSRADYGIYKPLLENLSKDKGIDITIVAFGMHLQKKFGNTIKKIKEDNFGKIDTIEGMSHKDSSYDIAVSYSHLIEKFAQYWIKNSYDYVIALGDRFEMSAAVQSGIPFEIKFIHLHGGETTIGSLDNIYRHQITLASCIHFVSSDHHLKKVASLVGSKEKVYNFGALSLDNIDKINLTKWSKVCKKFSLPQNQNFILVTFHPETVGLEKNKHYSKIVFESLKKISEDSNIIITMPNADASGTLYRKLMIKLAGDLQEKIFLVEDFGRENYFSAMHNCSMMIGNTSSGIIEAASFKKYVINVGDRQKGRLKNDNVFDVSFSKNEIIKKYNYVKKLGEFSGKNIFYKKNTSQKILKTIKDHAL